MTANVAERAKIKLEAYGVTLEAEGDVAAVERAVAVWYTAVLTTVQLIGVDDRVEAEAHLRKMLATLRGTGPMQ